VLDDPLDQFQWPSLKLSVPTDWNWPKPGIRLGAMKPALDPSGTSSEVDRESVAFSHH
jgi:hypothetical protein